MASTMLQVLAFFWCPLPPIFAFVETWLFDDLRPVHVSPARGGVSDLTRSRAELIAANALRRPPFSLLQRQVKRRQLTKGDRLRRLFWASRLRHWTQALLIVKPVTLLPWHRAGFRLFWSWKSRADEARPSLPQTTIDLIRRMARENPLWGAERIRSELLTVGIQVAKRTLPSAASRSTGAACDRNRRRVRPGPPA
jgi:hypothetical protein